MKISQLIIALNNIRKEVGDVEVYTYKDEDVEVFTKDNILYRPDNKIDWVEVPHIVI